MEKLSDVGTERTLQILFECEDCFHAALRFVGLLRRRDLIVVSHFEVRTNRRHRCEWNTSPGRNGGGALRFLAAG